MIILQKTYSKFFLCGILISTLFLPVKGVVEVVDGNTYADLVSLFKEFREFQKPKMLEGVLDYTLSTMKKQKEHPLMTCRMTGSVLSAMHQKKILNQ